VTAKKDYRKVLGVKKDASELDIKQAYRRLALQYHPDRNKDAGAEARFKEINEAYAILSGKQSEPVIVPAPRARGREERAMTDWASVVMGIWQEMEEEKGNNMYR
jgi:hypothetical protein